MKKEIEKLGNYQLPQLALDVKEIKTLEQVKEVLNAIGIKFLDPDVKSGALANIPEEQLKAIRFLKQQKILK